MKGSQFLKFTWELLSGPPACFPGLSIGVGTAPGLGEGFVVGLPVLDTCCIGCGLGHVPWQLSVCLFNMSTNVEPGAS